LSECWYRQSTEQRADEQVSHGRSQTDERVKPIEDRLLERHVRNKIAPTVARDYLGRASCCIQRGVLLTITLYEAVGKQR
jgi:hypothetical protein